MVMKEIRCLFMWMQIATVLYLFCSGIMAAPKTAAEAALAVEGWLRFSPQPLGMDLGQVVVDAVPFPGPEGMLLYYAVYLDPSGYVVVSADDLVEPIIAFAADGVYSDSDTTPLGALVDRDLRQRLLTTREVPQNRSNLNDASKGPSSMTSQSKWGYLAGSPNESKRGVGNKWLSTKETISDTTDENGIYALVGIPSNYTCTIQVYPVDNVIKPYEPQTITTGQSQDNTTLCGNVWNVGFN